VADNKIAGRAGDTYYGTLFVRSIVVVTKELTDYTSLELSNRGTSESYLIPRGGADRLVLPDSVRRRLEVKDI
jgi:hypothetical protein